MIRLTVSVRSFRFTNLSGGARSGLLVLCLALSAAPWRVYADGIGRFVERPTISARAAVVVNPDNGRLIYAKSPHRRLPPASTTKVLTALLALDNLDLNAKVMVSHSAANTVPSRIGFRSGEQLYVQDLLYAIMLKSGNDAAEVAAETVGGSVSGFARLMNARARELGALNSHFRNPHGLPDDGHYSTAYDLALIFAQAMRNPVFAEIVRTRKAALRIESGFHADEWRLVRVSNTNRLLTSYPGANGGKTGYTRKARRCFVGEAQRGSVRLVVAVLGSTRRWSDVKKLFEYGFDRYDLERPTITAAPPTHNGLRLTGVPRLEEDTTN
jgi:D-alanyl-D-alanine carboxypeptidase